MIDSGRYLEHLLEVRRLPSVRHIKNAIRAFLRCTVPDRGQVRGGVQETAISLLHEQRLITAIAILQQSWQANTSSG